MARLKESAFTTIKTEGSILPADLISRIARGDPSVPGLSHSDYGLFAGEKINEAVSRSWNRVVAAWNKFKAATDALHEGDPGTTSTRNFLLILLDELGYDKPLYQQKPIEIEANETKQYPVSHFWGNSPIHMVGFRVDLDKRTPGVKGASTASPHSMVQEFLNRSEAHLWGFVSNGLRLRILRDNITLTRQAYVEFDLQSMMDGEVYSDFTLLWLLCHKSRVEGEKPHECWLEKRFQFSAQEGVRALDGLRGGVEKAISALGAGFLCHPANRELKEKLRSGTLSIQDYYRQLLRLVYRLIFLFVSEERGLLLIPSAPEEAKERFTRHYSTARIRRMSQKVRGTRHSDIWLGLKLVMDRLSSDTGCHELALPSLGSFLWGEKAIPDLIACHVSNRDFLDAVRPLSFLIEGKVKRVIDYRNMGAEELGSVYESLLELHPQVNADACTFTLGAVTGSERKSTGSYYTPASLIHCLLDSALDPVLDEAARKENPEQAILSLKICDPACGSGHFLIAAAHRLAKRLASVRTGDEEPSPDAVKRGIRDVIGRCIYGVDINPMAVELCKVSLWMEALEPGKPLSFLEHHVKCGNSLIGTTPALMDKGIPDEAFSPIEGDDRKFCTEYKKKNRKEREGYGKRSYKGFKYDGQVEMFDQRDRDFAPWERLGSLATAMMGLDGIDDGSIEGIHSREKQYDEMVRSQDYIFNKLLADAWCAAFVWKKRRTGEFDYPISEEIFRKIERTPFACPIWMRDEIIRLAGQYQFFHWHLEFPGVFKPVIARSEATKQSHNEHAGWSGGFDVVLGNPPWERIKLQEKEWFSARRPDIAGAPNAATRKKMITALQEQDPPVFNAYIEDLRRAEGESFLIRSSGRYPLCGRGDVNTYTIFAELNRSLVGPRGMVGCIVPSGIATDDTTKFFFQDLMKTKTLKSLFDFENRKGLFPAVDSRMKFCLITMAGEKMPATAATFAFFLHGVEGLKAEEKVFTLTREDIELLNPNTRTCPIFRSRKDAELTKAIYRRVPVLIQEGLQNGNIWSIDISRMFHGSDDSPLFIEADKEVNEPLINIYEAKCFWQFDHRFASFNFDYFEVPTEEKLDPAYIVRTRFQVRCSQIPEKFRNKILPWLLSYRIITNSTNERTIVSSIIPKCGLMNSGNNIYGIDVLGSIALMANFNSFILDFLCRQSMGGTNLHLYIFQQLPVLPRLNYDQFFCVTSTLSNWLLPRVLELTYTAWDLEPFAKDCGYDGPPFRWDETRRFLIRCELDAAYFHLYEIQREDVDYIMETFPIVKRKDEAKYGEYRTKRVILEIYDKLTEAMKTAIPYKTLLDPPPADPSCAHSS